MYDAVVVQSNYTDKRDETWISPRFLVQLKHQATSDVYGKCATLQGILKLTNNLKISDLQYVAHYGKLKVILKSSRT